MAITDWKDATGASLPGALDYFTLTGQIAIPSADSEDSGLNPDIIDVVGQVVLTPTVTEARFMGTVEADPLTLALVKIPVQLNRSGQLFVIDREAGARILNSSDPLLNPSGWSYEVRFEFEDVDEYIRPKIAPFTITPPPPRKDGEHWVLDITNLAEVSEQTGKPVSTEVARGILAATWEVARRIEAGAIQMQADAKGMRESTRASQAAAQASAASASVAEGKAVEAAASAGASAASASVAESKSSQAQASAAASAAGAGESKKQAQDAAASAKASAESAADANTKITTALETQKNVEGYLQTINTSLAGALLEIEVDNENHRLRTRPRGAETWSEWLNLTPGPQGETGPAPGLTIGTVTTGEDWDATFENTATGYTLNFTAPTPAGVSKDLVKQMVREQYEDLELLAYAGL